MEKTEIIFFSGKIQPTSFSLFNLKKFKNVENHCAATSLNGTFSGFLPTVNVSVLREGGRCGNVIYVYHVVSYILREYGYSMQIQSTKCIQMYY